MKIFETIKASPKITEILTFSAFVFAGAIFKMRKMHESGVKITFARFAVETFMSFFIATVFGMVIRHFFEFDIYFTCALCSLAGSVSSTLFHGKLEGLVSSLFDGVNQYLKIKKNGQ